jgi:signal peptidase I
VLQQPVDVARNYMRRILLIFAILIGALLGVFILGRLTNVIGFYTIKAGSSLPTLNVNSVVLSSRLIKPVNADYIIFWFTDSFYGRQPYIFRQVADEGDVIKIENGIAYVNSVNIDNGLNLLQYYKVEAKDLTDLDSEAMMLDSNLFVVPRETKGVQGAIFKGVLMIEEATLREQGVTTPGYDNNWTLDNFGPYKVPVGHVFVLADNRHGGRDSRYIGPVSKDSITSTVFLK